MTLTHLTRLTDTVIKQGDSASRIGFRLKSNDQRDFNGPAKVQLINGQGQVHEIVADVKANQLYLGFDEVLPADIYTVEVEIDGYVFPSAKDRKITIRPNVDLDESEEIIALKRLSVQEEVDKYLKAHKADQEDLDSLMDRLRDRLPQPYDDGPLQAQISQILTQIEELRQSGGQSTQYDDTAIKNQLSAIQQVIQQREAAYEKLIEDSKEALAQLKNGTAVQPGQSIKISKSDVLFNLVNDSYIDRIGRSVTYVGWSETEYIDISDSIFVKINGAGNSSYNAWYDSNRMFIKFFSYSGENILERPENAHYIRLSNSTFAMQTLTIQKWQIAIE